VSQYDYLQDGAEIYRRSFATIKSEADLSSFAPEEAHVAIRVIHACGMVEIARDILFSRGAVKQARAALEGGAPILCDSQMLAQGVISARLPRANAVMCTLQDSRVPPLAQKLGTTRSAAAIEFWRDKLAGAVVAIGNAPTALFHLLQLLDEGVLPPACIIGMPVGFVGAAESKDALIASNRVPFITIKGRKGGSAMAAAALNAIASDAL